MFTAFQPNAFQQTAFQIGGAAGAVTPQPEADDERGPFIGRPRWLRRRRQINNRALALLLLEL